MTEAGADELNSWAANLQDALRRVESVRSRLQSGAPQLTEACAAAAELIAETLHGIREARGDGMHAESAAITLSRGRNPTERYATSLRAAYEAMVQIEIDRGLAEPGPTDVVGSLLDDAERDAYGPRGRSGAE